MKYIQVQISTIIFSTNKSRTVAALVRRKIKYNEYKQKTHASDVAIITTTPPAKSACVTPGTPQICGPPQAEIPISPDVVSASIENVLHSARSADRKWRILVIS